MAPTLARLGTFLREENAAGRDYLPAPDAILRAFEVPLSAVRVLIVGQDPYPTPGDPVGLSFSVPAGHPLPRSLQNIAKELAADTGEVLASGDLTAWQAQGVMLLNRVLTVRPGVPSESSWPGLGGVHGACHPRPRGARRTVGRRALGARRTSSWAPTGPDCSHRERPPFPAQRFARILRFTPVFQGKCTLGGTGRWTHSLGDSLATRRRTCNSY